MKDRKSVENEDFGCPILDAFMYVPEGIYDVAFVRYDRPVNVFGPDERRIFFHWKIVTPGEYFEVQLFQSFKHYERWGTQSKYYRCWCLAAGQRPRRRTRMTPDVFKGKIFKASVEIVQPKYEDGPFKGKSRPEAEWYSVVRNLLEIIAG